MKYTGNICRGCNKVFTQDDDIVVCPECGTPQHRECYEKENRCVNYENHAEGIVWKSEIRQEPEKKTEKKEEMLTCPNCGHQNPPGTTVCESCSMKFTLFGMNVVDAINREEREKTNNNKDIPDYQPPFTLGQGEGFENTNKSNPDEAPATPSQVAEALTEILSGNNQTESDGRLRFNGPFPQTDEIDGVRTNTIGNFIGSNAMSYISKFKKLQSGKKLSFNFAAFFLTPFWFFYRKLYKQGIIFMTAFITISILAVPASLEAAEYAQQLLSVTAAENASPEQLLEIYNEFIRNSAPMLIFSALSFAIRLFSGFFANHSYKKYVIEQAGKAERLDSMNTATSFVIKYGGASIFIAIGAFFANELLTMLISYML